MISQTSPPFQLSLRNPQRFFFFFGKLPAHDMCFKTVTCMAIEYSLWTLEYFSFILQILGCIYLFSQTLVMFKTRMLQHQQV